MINMPEESGHFTDKFLEIGSSNKQGSASPASNTGIFIGVKIAQNTK